MIFLRNSPHPLRHLKGVLIVNLGSYPNKQSKRLLAYPMDDLNSISISHHECSEGETGDSSFNLLGTWVENRPTALSNSTRTYPVAPFLFFARWILMMSFEGETSFSLDSNITQSASCSTTCTIPVFFPGSIFMSWASIWIEPGAGILRRWKKPG